MFLRVKYPEEVRFSCIRCARCCRERKVLLLPEDVERLARVTGLSPDDFAVPVEGLKPYTHRLRKSENSCVFLEGGRCAVYSYRPISCRFYPFILFSIGAGYVFIVDDACPGLGKGPRLGREFFENLLSLYLEWRTAQSDELQLLKYSLKIRRRIRYGTEIPVATDMSLIV